MPEQTVQVALGRIVAAEAEYQAIATDELMLHVQEHSRCMPSPDSMPLDQLNAWNDQWIAPDETHEHIPQHRWDERTAMVADRLCAPCPVRQACLALTERLPRLYEGWIRGGLTPAQRRLEPAPETVEEGR